MKRDEELKQEMETARKRAIKQTSIVEMGKFEGEDFRRSIQKAMLFEASAQTAALIILAEDKLKQKVGFI
jgi:hypothetical protein